MATTSQKTADGLPPPNKRTIEGDPLDITGRLYGQVGRLLDDIEQQDEAIGITVPQRISALIACGRILIMFQALRKAEHEPDQPGGKVRTYATAFRAKTNAVGGRATSSRPSAVALAAAADDDDPDTAA